MSQQLYKHIVKVIVVGNSNVGKSSLMHTYINGCFSKIQAMTIGFDFLVKNVLINNEIVRVQIWDTAGQERYRSIVSSYYRGSNATLIVYDVSNRESFNDIVKWLDMINCKSSYQNIPILLLGNKTDLEHREVSEQEGQEFAAMHDIMFMEVSAKSNVNVESAFTSVLQKINMNEISNPILGHCKTCTMPIRKNESHYNCYGPGSNYDNNKNGCCS
jgi:small GTP-binding protein